MYLAWTLGSGSPGTATLSVLLDIHGVSDPVVGPRVATLVAAARAGVTAAELRADRLLSEANASGGDPLLLARMFGVRDPTAIRYCAEVVQVGGGAERR